MYVDGALRLFGFILVRGGREDAINCCNKRTETGFMLSSLTYCMAKTRCGVLCRGIQFNSCWEQLQ